MYFSGVQDIGYIYCGRWLNFSSVTILCLGECYESFNTHDEFVHCITDCFDVGVATSTFSATGKYYSATYQRYIKLRDSKGLGFDDQVGLSVCVIYKYLFCSLGIFYL